MFFADWTMLEYHYLLSGHLSHGSIILSIVIIHSNLFIFWLCWYLVDFALLYARKIIFLAQRIVQLEHVSYVCIPYPRFNCIIVKISSTDRFQVTGEDWQNICGSILSLFSGDLKLLIDSRLNCLLHFTLFVPIKIEGKYAITLLVNVCNRNWRREQFNLKRSLSFVSNCFQLIGLWAISE